MQDSYRWTLLFALSLIGFVINVDYTAVNLALMPMAAVLHTPLDTIQWVLSGYVIAWAIFVVPGGQCADKYGQKVMCLLGLTLFLLASLLAGVAHSAAMLIAARVLQGVAGALYIPTLYGLIHLNFSEHERGRAMGMVSLATGLGLACGPVIGGVLLSWLSWPSIFFVNLPIGMVAIFIIARAQDDTAARRHTAFLIPWKLFTNASFVGIILGMLLEQYGFSSVLVSSGLFLRKILQFSLFQSSAIYLMMTVVFAVVSAFAGAWVDRVGLRFPIVLGLIIMMLGAAAFSALSAVPALWMVCAVFIILGAGMGFAFAGLNTGIVKTVQQQEIGFGSSFFLMSALVGNFLGVTLTTLTYEQYSLSKMLTFLQQSGAKTQGFHIKALLNYIADISGQGHDLNAFTLPLQKMIQQNAVAALSNGISHAMMITAFVMLCAAGLSAVLIQWRSVVVASLVPVTALQD